MSIPEIIHLMWFSGGEFPDSIKKCIDSWKKVLPDYKIQVWTKEDVIKTNIQYAIDAVNCRKWAFASDVMRLYVLYQWGGVYMDADIYLLNGFDAFLTNKVVLFHEHHSGYDIGSQTDADGNRLVDHVRGFGIQAAFIASEKENPYIKELLEYYSDKRFTTDKNGKIKAGELISPAIYALTSEKYGYKYKETVQRLSIGDAIVYPSKYLASNQSEDTAESFAIHMCAHSWYDYSKFQLLKIRIKKLLNRVLKNNDILDAANTNK